MASARVLSPSLSTSPRSSLALNASIYVSARNACIRPLFRISSTGNASAARPAILSPRSPMSLLSHFRSLNNFLTVSIAVRSLLTVGSGQTSALSKLQQGSLYITLRHIWRLGQALLRMPGGPSPGLTSHILLASSGWIVSIPAALLGRP